MPSALSACLDIETLDTEDTAMIIEIGLVAFDRSNFSIVDRLAIPLDIFDQLLRGRTVSQDTIDYHRKKGSLPTTFSGALPLDAMASINRFFKEYPPEHLWIQGPDFDLPKLRSYFAPIKTPLPWEYYKVRDSRTIWDAAYPDVKHPPRPHKAVPDCEATIADLANALAELNRTAAA